jgi:enoyl-CoA hydratase
MSGIRVEHDGAVTVVTIDRPEVRNAVDRPTAEALAGAFRAFDADPERSVAVLAGAGGVSAPAPTSTPSPAAASA